MAKYFLLELSARWLVRSHGLKASSVHPDLGIDPSRILVQSLRNPEPCMLEEMVGKAFAALRESYRKLAITFGCYGPKNGHLTHMYDIKFIPKAILFYK